MTQCEMIVNYMEHNGSITPKDAMLELGCYRLASRITDLRQKGFPIEVEMIAFTKWNGEKSRYAKYSLGESYNKDKVHIVKGAIYYAN